MNPVTFIEKIENLVKIKPPPASWHDTNPKITAIHEPRPCEDCGRMVTGRSVEIYIKRWTRNPDWIKSCNICKEKTPLEKFGKKKP